MASFRHAVVLLGAAAALVLSAAPAVAAPARTVDVTGAVGDPAGYAPAQLAGASLYDVVERAAPRLPAGKNTGLRVTVRVTGRQGRSSTFALGELDPGFGNHRAVFSAWGGKVTLRVPGDRLPSRTVPDVQAVQVAVSATGVTAVPAGAVRIIAPHREVTLPAWLLAHLPARTVEVSFEAGTAPQTHTETGPALSAALLAAGVWPAGGMPVVAVGGDGYGAAVTLDEDYVGGRPLLLSTMEDGVALAQPRLVPVGDVKGGRYVSDVVTLAADGAA